jgi:hypothetical protein
MYDGIATSALRIPTFGRSVLVLLPPPRSAVRDDTVTRLQGNTQGQQYKRLSDRPHAAACCQWCRRACTTPPYYPTHMIRSSAPAGKTLSLLCVANRTVADWRSSFGAFLFAIFLLSHLRTRVRRRSLGVKRGRQGSPSPPSSAS